VELANTDIDPLEALVPGDIHGTGWTWVYLAWLMLLVDAGMVTALSVSKLRAVLRPTRPMTPQEIEAAAEELARQLGKPELKPLLLDAVKYSRRVRNVVGHAEPTAFGRPDERAERLIEIARRFAAQDGTLELGDDTSLLMMKPTEGPGDSEFRVIENLLRYRLNTGVFQGCAEEQLLEAFHEVAHEEQLTRLYRTIRRANSRWSINKALETARVRFRRSDLQPGYWADEIDAEQRAQQLLRNYLGRKEVPAPVQEAMRKQLEFYTEQLTAARERVRNANQ
jgi:hypothetical protein